MYTHPDFTHQCVGRLILKASECAAETAGFKAVEMAATLAGEPFYARCGYNIESCWENESGPVSVPLITMVKVFE